MTDFVYIPPIQPMLQLMKTIKKKRRGKQLIEEVPQNVNEY